MKSRYIKTWPPLSPELHQTKVHLIFGFNLLMGSNPHKRKDTQSDLSKFTKVGPAQISNMLNVKHPYTPTMKTLTKLVNHYDMTVTEFYLMVAENITPGR